jgi:outer membrane protein assembly factor BamB
MNRQIWIIIFSIVVVLLGIVAIAEWLHTQPSDSAATSPQASASFGGPDWPIFRGNSAMTGVATGAFPDKFALAWKFKTGDAIKSSPVVAEGRVFVGSQDKKVYAVALADGKPLWNFATKDVIEAAPSVADGLVFVGSNDSFIYALDTASGTLKWSFETGDKIIGSVNPVRASDGKRILVFGSYDNNIYALDAAGAQLWKYETGSYVNGAPAVDSGLAVAGGCDARLHIVQIADGRSPSQIDLGAYVASSTALSGGRAWLGNYEGAVFCADLAAGKILWKQQPSEAPILSSPAVLDNRIVYGCDDKNLYCLDASDGKQLWKFAAAGEIQSSPVICGDKVLVGSSDGRIYLLRLADGTQLWSYEIGSPITASPAVAAGVLLVAAEDGTLYAFRARP